MRRYRLNIFPVFILFFFVFLSTMALAKQIKDISFYEKELLSMLLKEDKTKHYGLYLLAGIELIENQELDYAEKYLKLAALEKVPEGRDPSELFVRLVQIAYLKKEKEMAREWLLKMPNNNSNIVNIYRRWVGIPTVTSDSPLEEGSGFDIKEKEANLVELLKKGDYLKAQEMLSPEKVEDSGLVDMMALYDLIFHINNQKVAFEKPLLCEKIWKEFKTSKAYGIFLCDLLQDFRKTKLIHKKKLNDLASYLKENEQEMEFLTTAVSQLKI